MESVSQPTLTIDVPVGLLVLEDEEEVSKNLKFKLGQSFGKAGCVPLHRENTEAALVITPTITVADNLEAASRLVVSGGYDVILADVMVYREEVGAPRGMASCLSLLKEIAKRKSFISVVGHSAFPELAEEALANGWMVDAVNKSARDSVPKVVERSVETAVATAKYRASLQLGLDELKLAAAAESPVDREASLVAAREVLSRLEAPVNLPEEYRRALATFVPLLYRHSTVPSERFRLLSFSREFAEVSEPFLTALASPMFDYEKHAFSAFCELDALGYEVVMGLDIDEKELLDEPGIE